MPRAEPVVGLSSLLLSQNTYIPCVPPPPPPPRGIYLGAQLWLTHALMIPVFSVSSGWLRLLKEVSFLLCVFFLVPLFLHSSAVPCCLKAHLPFPVSCSLSHFIRLCLLLSLYSVARCLFSSSFPSSSCAISPDQTKLFYTLLSFLFALLISSYVLSFDCPHGAPETVGCASHVLWP